MPWFSVLRQERQLASAKAAAAAIEGAIMEMKGVLDDSRPRWEAIARGRDELSGLVHAVAEQQVG